MLANLRPLRPPALPHAPPSSVWPLHTAPSIYTMRPAPGHLGTHSAQTILKQNDAGCLTVHLIARGQDHWRDSGVLHILQKLLAKQLQGPSHLTRETSHGKYDETWRNLSPAAMDTFQPRLPLLQTQANTLASASPIISLKYAHTPE